jgi:hypothetical protein
VKGLSTDSYRTNHVVALAIILTVLLHCFIAITGCAIRGFHLDAEEIRVTPSRAPYYLQSHPDSETNLIPSRVDGPQSAISD